MPVSRTTFALLGIPAVIATMPAATDSTVRDMFLLIILSLGTAVIGTVPDPVAAMLPEKCIDEREAQRDMHRIYLLMGEIGCVILLVIGAILYRDGVSF